MFGMRKQEAVKTSWLDNEKLYLLEYFSQVQLEIENLEAHADECAKTGLHDDLMRVSLAVRLFSIRVLPLIGAVPRKNFAAITAKALESADVIEDVARSLAARCEEKGLDLSPVLTTLRRAINALIVALRLR